MTVAPYSRISELPAHSGKSARVRGWVTHVRSSGKVAFVVLRDGTGIVQAVVVKSQVSADAWDVLKQLTIESSIALDGEVRADARSPGGHELGVTQLTQLGASPIDYPI